VSLHQYDHQPTIHMSDWHMTLIKTPVLCTLNLLT